MKFSKIKKNIKLCACGLGIFGVVSCASDDKDIVATKVAVMVRDYTRKHSAECRAGLLKEAEGIVDSMLLTEAQQEIRDSLSRAKPGRPFEPPVVPPIDTLKIQPIFKNVPEPSSKSREIRH